MDLLQQALLRLHEAVEDGLAEQELVELLDLAADLMRLASVALQQRRAELLSGQGGRSNETESGASGFRAAGR